MEPECSLPHSQIPATCPYSEPARSSNTLTSYSLKIHLNIILLSTPGPPKWSLSLRFPHQNPVHASPPPIRATCPAHLILLDFYHQHNIGWAVQIMNMWKYYRNKPDATIGRNLFTAKSLYMFRASQHPSSGALETVTATSGIGHNTGTPTSFQRGLIRTEPTTLEGSSCTSIMTYTRGSSYRF